MFQYERGFEGDIIDQNNCQLSTIQKMLEITNDLEPIKVMINVRSRYLNSAVVCKYYCHRQQTRLSRFVTSNACP
jgi:hypothetical protein